MTAASMGGLTSVMAFGDDQLDAMIDAELARIKADEARLDAADMQRTKVLRMYAAAVKRAAIPPAWASVSVGRRGGEGGDEEEALAIRLWDLRRSGWVAAAATGSREN